MGDSTRGSTMGSTRGSTRGSTTFGVQSKTATASLSLADVKFDTQHVERHEHQQREYSRDEFLYALSSPSSIGAMAWIASAFFAVIYGSSVVVYLNFCIPLLVGPYVIKEQMPAQLFPSVERKYNKLQSEANALSIKNVQLKGTVSKMQRQEYRLSAAEERFEHLCQRSEKDIVKMKQLARKNASLRQKIKINEAGKRLQELLTSTTTVGFNGDSSISEKKVQEVVMLMKEFAGKNSTSKFDKDVFHRAVVNSMTKNIKPAFISSVEPDTQTRDFEGDYDLRNFNEGESEEGYSNMDIIARPSKQSHEEKPDDDSQGEDSWALSKSSDSGLPLKSDPSGPLHEERRNKGDFRGMIQKNTASAGTADRPIDIEKLLFNNHSGNKMISSTE